MILEVIPSNFTHSEFYLSALVHSLTICPTFNKGERRTGENEEHVKLLA